MSNTMTQKRLPEPATPNSQRMVWAAGARIGDCRLPDVLWYVASLRVELIPG
jgi:hypothetical protein